MTATKIQPGDDTHLTLLMAPHALNFVTGPDRAALLAFGRDVFAAARASQCLAQIEEPALPVAPVLDDRWKARMLDGRAPERDEMGFGNHPELPFLDEGMMPRSFFAALGLELAHTSAEDQLDGDVLGAMSEAVNWSRWMPTAPKGDGWKLVSIFDTEDGPVAWWLRELPEAEDGTTTIRNLQAEVEQLKARSARAAQPTAVAGSAGEREAFETWARSKTDWNPNLERKGDGYAGGFAQTAWEAWRGRGAAPALEAPTAVAPLHPPMPENWAVVAAIEGQDILCISSNALSGKGELTESEEQAVIGMARHLLAFAGYGLSPCDFDPDAEPHVVVGLASREDDRARMEAERNDSLDRYRLIAEVPCTEANAYKDGFAAGWGRRGEAAAAAQEAAQPAQSAG